MLVLRLEKLAQKKIKCMVNGLTRNVFWMIKVALKPLEINCL